MNTRQYACVSISGTDLLHVAPAACSTNPSDVVCWCGASAAPLPLLRHVAACGSCLLLLLLSCHVPCTAAQDEQDIDLTAGATGAMRMLTGVWQGTVKTNNWDFGVADYVCAQQIIFGNGTIVQVRR